jgi:DNA (cytosine-5)-methyltransferase 1
MKILNLYACLGGNRYKWNEVKNDIKVTAIELDKEAANLYKKRFPNDNVIVTDAHDYLLKHYNEFDFIWSSPPCPSHSKARLPFVKNNKIPAVYPNMNLYEEIILLNNFFKGKFCIENVIPYYEPLIKAQKRGRHLYWCNFNLPYNLSNRHVTIGGDTKDEFNKLCNFHDFNFNLYKGEQPKIKMARNLVDYEAGKTIFATALNIIDKTNTKQFKLF